MKHITDSISRCVGLLTVLGPDSVGPVLAELKPLLLASYEEDEADSPPDNWWLPYADTEPDMSGSKAAVDTVNTQPVLEYGKRYRRRDGVIVGPLVPTNRGMVDAEYPFAYDCWCWTPYGQYVVDQYPDPYDLVEEVSP